MIPRTVVDLVSDCISRPLLYYDKFVRERHDDISSALLNCTECSGPLYLQLYNKPILSPYKQPHIININCTIQAMWSGAEYQIVKHDQKKEWTITNIHHYLDEPILQMKSLFQTWKWVKDKIVDEHCFAVYNKKVILYSVSDDNVTCNAEGFAYLYAEKKLRM